MQPLSIIATFCEDIRDESNGQIMLVGVMQDNIHLQNTEKSGTAKGESAAAAQKILTKLAIYIRTNFDTRDQVPEIQFQLVMPDDNTIDIGKAEKFVIELSRKQAKENGNPLAGLITRAVLVNFRPSRPGLVRVDARVGKEVRTAGILNCLSVPNAGSPKPSSSGS